MPNDEWYDAGRRLRSLVAGFLGTGGVEPAYGSEQSSSSRYSASAQQPGPGWYPAAPFPGRPPYPTKDGREVLYGQCNTAAVLRSGHLIVSVLPSNACYQIDPRDGSITYLFELNWASGTLLWSAVPDASGSIYCTLSGMRTQPPIVDAEFGNWGAVAVVNHRANRIRTIVERGRVVDPCGLQVLQNGKLLVADFADFGGSGLVYIVDPLDGALTVLAESGEFREPTCAWMDDEGILWVANADQAAQDGEIIRIDRDGRRQIAFGRQGPQSGATPGVFGSHRSGYLIFVKNAWPNVNRSTLYRLDRRNGEATPVLRASDDQPRFFSTLGAIDEDILWIVDSYNRELLKVGISTGATETAFDLTSVMQGHRGMRNSFDAVATVAMVPYDLSI